MNKAISVLFLIGIVSLTSCSSSDNLVEVSVTTAARPVIPSTTASCLARRVGIDTSTSPSYDIASAYFTIPTMTFTPKNSKRDVYISFIKISYSLPGDGNVKQCTYGGDDLAALRDDWWLDPLKQAKISAGSTDDDKKIQCPIYCGGIDKELPPFSTTLTITVYGVDQDPNNENDAVGFSTTTSMTITKQY